MILIALKNLIRKTASISILIFMMFAISACVEKFEEVDASFVQGRWEESIKHSAVSWWYIGEKDGYYYILEKWPLKQYGYKVSQKYISVEIGKPIDLTFDESEWINLKVGQIHFK